MFMNVIALRMCTLYSRHAQHTARGLNVARKSLQYGPQSPNLRIFGLIFDGNTIKIRKKLNQSGPRIFQQHIFWPAMKSELCIPFI